MQKRQRCRRDCCAAADSSEEEAKKGARGVARGDAATNCIEERWAAKMAWAHVGGPGPPKQMGADREEGEEGGEGAAHGVGSGGGAGEPDLCWSAKRHMTSCGKGSLW